MAYPYNNNMFGSVPYVQPQPIMPQMPYTGNQQQPMPNNFVPQGQSQQPTNVVNSANKIYVTSLQDALSRFSSPNTTLTYTMQDEKFEIEVYTDAQGKKSYQMFERILYNPTEEKNNAPQEPLNFVGKDELSKLQEDIKAQLESLGKTQVDIQEQLKNIPQPNFGDYATKKELQSLRDEMRDLKQRNSNMGGKRNAE